MRLTVITPSTDEIISLEEAKAHLNVTTAADDALILRLIATAVAKLDGPKGLLGRSLAPTQYRMTLDAFTRVIQVPLPPVRSVEAVTYTDADGTTVTIAASAYRVTGLDDDTPAEISLPGASRWPPTPRAPEAVQILFTAGYGTIPIPLASAILMHVAHLYENREASLVGVSAQVLPMGYDDLVEPYKMWGCG